MPVNCIERHVVRIELRQDAWIDRNLWGRERSELGHLPSPRVRHLLWETELYCRAAVLVFLGECSR